MSESGDRLQVIADNALGEFATETGGGIVTGYTMIVDYMDSNGDRCWATAHAENQKPATTLGLLRWATLAVENQVLRYMNDCDE
jgi:hypothetical protein